MTETVSAPETQTAAPPIIPRPATDNAALRAIEEAEHVRGTSILDRGSGQPAAN
ncbi:MAG: hypothetical protein ACRDPY_16735 [Streptosporangiaceae bacterium]